MAILTTSGVATFNATSNMNVRVSWSESFDTTTITSSKPYGTSTIKITKVEALTKNWYGWDFCPSFWLKFNGKEIHEFTSTYAKQSVRLNSTGVWGTILNANGTIFTTSFTYNRTNTSETKNFTLTESTTDGWTYPCFYMVGKTSSPTYTNIGGGSSTWTASATLATLYTAPSAPTSIYIATIDGESIKTGNYYYYKHGGKVRLYWPAGTPGTNNTIERYRIYVSFKGSSYSATTAYSSNTVTINNNTYYYYDVGGDGDAKRGDYQTYKIQAIGKYSNSDLSSAVSPRLYKNRLPSAPTGITKTVASTEMEGPLAYTVGSDPDGQAVKIYYSTSKTGGKKYYNGSDLEVGTYYLWAYDGLEYSDSYGTAIIRKDTKAPSVSSFSITENNFVPYYSNSSYRYVTTINLTSVSATKGQYSNFAKYNFYYSKGSKANSTGITSPTGTLISSSSSAPSASSPISLNVGDIITPGYYFKIGVSVTTSLNESSPINWSSAIYCCGKAITIDDFSPTISVDSKIDNSRNDINNASDIANYFNNYIKITWNNPSITSIRFGISKIECGITDNNITTFTSITTYTKSGESFIPSVMQNASNTGYLNIGNLISRGASVIPAIRVTPINGTSFIVSSKITKIRTNPLEFSSFYSIIPKTWYFFTDQSIKNISFDGNKIKGDADFATIKKVTIKNSELKTSYKGEYTIVSGANPGHIIFSSDDFNTFKNNLNGLGLDSLINTTYTISVNDRYGNSASTTIKQSIDFRVAPEWDVNEALKTEVYYLDSSKWNNVDDSITNINQRILNPGEKIKLSWNKAADPGNGDKEKIYYKITCYTKESTNTLYYQGDSKYFEDTTTSTSYEYEIPFGNTVVKSISFRVTAVDKSGLPSSKSLSTTSDQALAMGRAVSPDFDIISYEINKDGKLTGTLKIKDYGDSRAIASTWTNYTRLGNLKLIVQYGENQSDLTYDSNFNFSDNNYNYPTSGKVPLFFSLYPSYLDSLVSNKSYLFSFEGPTFSYRSHQIGINIPADSTSIEGSAFSVAAAGGKDKIYFVSNSPVLKDIYLNLTEGKIYNLIIDCGEW